MSNLADTRRDFPILDQQVRGRPLVYLDNAASTQKPRVVIEALDHYYLHDHSNVHRGAHELSNRATAAFEAARRRVAGYLNAAAADEIVFTRGTTESINLVANAWGRKNIGPGDVILLTEMEHHSNMVPWQMAAAVTGAEVCYIPVHENGAGLNLEQAHKLLASGRVRLLALAHISNTLAVLNPVKELCALAHRHGVVTLIDAAQSAGHLRIDVQDIGCDFLAFSGHKTAGPTGIGILYGRLELLEEMDPWQGGGEMISVVTYEKATWKTPPHKFEAGTPDIAGAVGLHAALDYLETVGLDHIFAHDLDLGAYAYRRMSEIPGIRILGPAEARVGIVTFTLADAHAADIVTLADQDGIALRGGHHCNEPLMHKLGCNATARASFYLYNTREEIDLLVDNLQRTIELFRR